MTGFDCKEFPLYAAAPKVSLDAALQSWGSDWRQYFKTFVFCNRDYCNAPDSTGFSIDLSSGVISPSNPICLVFFLLSVFFLI